MKQFNSRLSRDCNNSDEDNFPHFPHRYRYMKKLADGTELATISIKVAAYSVLEFPKTKKIYENHFIIPFRCLFRPMANQG